MSSIEPITFKIIESITPTINENIKILLDENNNYKQKYENLLNEHKMLLDFPFVKNIITNMKSEINTLKNKSEKITLEINEKKNSVTDIDTDNDNDNDIINIITKICNVNKDEAMKLLNKNNNDLIKTILYYQNNEDTYMNDDIVKCELCEHGVNCNRNNIFILQRETGSQLEELVHLALRYTAEGG